MNVLLLTMMMTLFFTSSTFADPAPTSTPPPNAHPIFGTMPADFAAGQETWKATQLLVRQIMANKFSTECVQLNALKSQEIDGFENYPAEVQNLVKRLEIMETYFLKDHCPMVPARKVAPKPIANMGKKAPVHHP